MVSILQAAAESVRVELGVMVHMNVSNALVCIAILELDHVSDVQKDLNPSTTLARSVAMGLGAMAT